MLRVEESAVYLTRGDTAYLEVELTDQDGEPFEAQEGDTLTLSVKQVLNDEQEYLFSKTVTPGEIFEIKPQDTRGATVGKYFYDVQLNTAEDEIFTVIEPSPFYIRNEVTIDD